MLQYMEQFNILDNPLHFGLNLIQWNSFKLTKHLKVFLCSEALPEDIKLRTYAYLLGNIFWAGIEALDVYIAFVAAEEADDDVDEGGFSCTIVT